MDKKEIEAIIEKERLLDSKQKRNFYTPTEKSLMIKKSEKELRNIFKDLDKDTKKTVDKLIESVAFMTVELKNLEKVIALHGQVEEYNNGGGQKGLKISAVADAYNKMKKIYLADVKVLTDIISADKEPQGLNASETLNKFILSK